MKTRILVNLKKAQKHAILTTNIFDILHVDAMEIEDKLISSKSQTQPKEKKEDYSHTSPWWLIHRFHETESRASRGVSILVNENIPQSKVTLNINLQAVAGKVAALKTITLWSDYLPPRNQFNFNPKDLQDVIDQLPFPFILMGHFNGYHTVGCTEVNNWRT